MLKNDKGEKIKEANAHGELLKAVSMIYKQVKEKHYVIITLNEGKKRHIRRMMKAM